MSRITRQLEAEARAARAAREAQPEGTYTAREPLPAIDFDVVDLTQPSTPTWPFPTD